MSISKFLLLILAGYILIFVAVYLVFQSYFGSRVISIEIENVRTHKHRFIDLPRVYRDSLDIDSPLIIHNGLPVQCVCDTGEYEINRVISMIATSD